MTHVKNILVCALLGAAVACGGGQKTEPTPVGGDGDEPPAEPTKDLIFKYDVESIEGRRFEPNALGIPGMWKISTPKRATLKKQRGIAGKQSAKVADLQVLAALAWTESSDKLAAARKEPSDTKKAKLEAEAQKLREEARDALRRAYTKAGEGKADEVTLKLLSVAEITLGDEAASAKAYAEIAQRFPAEGATNAKIWLTHLHLKSNKLAEAAKVVSGWKLAEGFNPMAAYVMAWVKYRQRDFAGAVKAMAFAAANWKSNAGGDSVMNELLLFLGNAGTPVAEGKAAVLAGLGDKADAEGYGYVYKLSKAYEFYGYPGHARDTLMSLLAGEVKAEVSPRDQVVFRAEAAYDALKVGDPAGTAKAAIDAHKKLAECGEPCAKTAPNIASALRTYATLLHTLYAHSMDEAYYAPAKEMYDYYLAIPDAPDLAQIKDYASRLADTKANAAAGQGVHDQGETQKLVKLRTPLVKACYEAVLQSEPALAGEVTLTINIDHTGAVTGAETVPPKGQAGLAAVAGCLDERSRSWKFPGRTLKGVTAVVQPFKFTPAGADSK